MSRSEKPTSAFSLAFIAGILILTNATFVAAAATWLPWIIPLLPGSSGNDATILYSVAAVGLVGGVLVAIDRLNDKPANKKAWG